jgi:hypothetical protein
MFYSWDRGKHHMELEIIPGQPAQFFYRNRETGQLWGEDYTIGTAVPAEALQRFKLFITDWQPSQIAAMSTGALAIGHMA